MSCTKEQHYKSMDNESKGKILAAGLNLFISKGLLATKVKDITSLAGTSKGLMYHYYKSKESLYYDLVDISINSINEYLNSFLNLELSPTEKIRAISSAMVEAIIKNDNIAQYLYFIHRAMIAENMQNIAIEHFSNASIPFEILERIINEGQLLKQFKNYDPKAMALLYWSAINGICSNKLIMGQACTSLTPKLLDDLIIVN